MGILSICILIVNMSSISFHSESIEFQLDSELQYSQWLHNIAKSHHLLIKELNYIFTSDEYLYDMNVQYLNHDYYTDIISFPMQSDPISGDIFISIDRVRENAAKNNVSFLSELHRVMAHGLLHFIGFDDHEEADILEMRNQEDKAMSLFISD